MKIIAKTVSNFMEDWPDGVPGRSSLKQLNCYQCDAKLEEKRYGFILWQHWKTIKPDGAVVYTAPSRAINVLEFCSAKHRAQWVKDRGDSNEGEIGAIDG